MYEERKDSFSLKDVVLQILFVVLFVFILIWLFPTKGYLNDRLDKIENSVDGKLNILYSRIFNENLMTMKDAAKDYFTTPRLPKNIGDKVSKTLREMQELNLVLPIIDSNGKQCDLDNSYVELTKMDDEYVMKVNLSCSDNEGYVIVHLGCYGYCETDLCEKEDETPSKPVVNPKPQPKPDTKPDPKPDPDPIVNKKYEWRYVYEKNTGHWSDWSDWSGWTTNVLREDDYTKVETKVEREFNGYEQEYGVIGTTYEPVYGQVAKEVTTYESKRVQTGTTPVRKLVGKTPIYVDKVKNTTTTPGSGYWTAKQRIDVTSPKSSTSTAKYTYINSYTKRVCNNVCKVENHYVYDVQYYKTSQGTSSTTYTCPSGTTPSTNGNGKCISGYQDVYQTTYEPVYGTQMVPVVKTVYENQITGYKPVYEYGYTNGDPIYKNVTKYRSKTRTYIPEKITDEKWSTENDTALLNKGYKKTGEKREIQ